MLPVATESQRRGKKKRTQTLGVNTTQIIKTTENERHIIL